MRTTTKCNQMLVGGQWRWIYITLSELDFDGFRFLIVSLLESAFQHQTDLLARLCARDYNRNIFHDLLKSKRKFARPWRLISLALRSTFLLCLSVVARQPQTRLKRWKQKSTWDVAVGLFIDPHKTLFMSLLKCKIIISACRCATLIAFDVSQIVAFRALGRT